MRTDILGAKWRSDLLRRDWKAIFLLLMRVRWLPFGVMTLLSCCLVALTVRTPPKLILSERIRNFLELAMAGLG